MPGGKPVDYYEISMRQFQQQILPAGLPKTTVWGYGAVKGSSRNA
jgi:spore coat protein A